MGEPFSICTGCGHRAAPPPGKSAGKSAHSIAVGRTFRMAALILALDVGTSSARSALFDARGDRLAETGAQQTYPLLTSAEGAAEIEPAELLRAVRLCLDETLQALRENRALQRDKIVAIGMSCFWHSLIGCDSQGHPLTRVITWADSRCRQDALALRERFVERKTHARTGCMLRASFWPAKLRWLRRTQARLFARVARWMSPAEWLQLNACGTANCAIGMATGNGLFNPSRLDWDASLLRHCELPREKLHRLSDEPVHVTGEFAGTYPELRGIPWFPAIGDGAASNLGSGVTRAGFAAINVGTSAALRVMRQGATAVAPFGLFCYRVDARRYLVGGAISNAGNLRAWCLRELKLASEAELEEQLARRPFPAPNLAVLPFWLAERAPTWNEEQPGVIHGIAQHTTALDLYQAITDASYHRLAQIADLVVAGEKTPPRFIVSGGIQRSVTALQRLADVLGHPVHPNDEMEASIRGSAIFALERLGGAPRQPKLAPAVKPRKNLASMFAEKRAEQTALEQQLLRRKR